MEGRLQIEPKRAVDEIVAAMRQQVGEVLGRSGAVVAVSGGVDSAVCAALAARAFGGPHVLALALPERESDPGSLALARELAATLQLELLVEEISPVLDGAGCYARRDAAIRRLTEFGPGWHCKLVVDAGGPGAEHLPLGVLVVRSPAGEERRVRLPPREYREIVAATNLKQRVRAMLCYHHADRLRYAVIGTPNRLEYALGFFVKGGDGLADIKPIAHLYKGQVHQLAEYLGVPAGIRSRVPTTDTYSLPQTQEEFYFGLPLPLLDRALAALDQGVTAEVTAVELGRDPGEIERVFQELERKARAARYLHLAPLLVSDPATPVAMAEVG
jgi:NAD+ synthase